METKSLKANHTPIPWRVGDAGHTIFGPKTDAPNPEIIAHMGNRATFKTNAQHIVKCVNMHNDLIDVLERLTIYYADETKPEALFKLNCAKKLLKKNKE